MEEIGQPRTALVAAFAFAALAVSVAGSVLAWPFAIDDAFIAIRYARHLAEGAGYVWNVGGPATDGVTPLPWAFVLVPVARASPLVVLVRVKLAGAIVWALTAFGWGWGVGRAKAPTWAKACAVAVLAGSLPVAAHSVSGMETAFATSLATVAATQSARPRVAAALGGLAATLRPELVVWSVVLASGFAWSAGKPGRSTPRGTRSSREWRVLAAASIAAVPFAACALIRACVFGRPAPLSVLAKPSDLAHGVAYAGAALVFTLAPLLLVCPVALARERGPARTLAIAALSHVAVIIAVGGDWMPYARLLAPIVPSMLLAFVLSVPHGRRAWHVARAAVALGLGAWFMTKNLPSLRRAGLDRATLITDAPPRLASAKRIAALDIGWVSAASEADIFDLAGVTDPDVAVLGGGHTSKRITPTFLLAHDPDLVVFYADPLPPTLDEATPASFPRVVEARLAASELFTNHLKPTALLPLGGRGAGYVIYARSR